MMPAKPERYRTVTPYLVFHGVDKLIDFLKRVFDAEVTLGPMRRPDGTVMHAEVVIGDSLVMMGEPTGQFQPMLGSLYVYVDDTDAAYQRALQAGGTSVLAPTDQFYGDRNAGVRDAFGNHWWIATQIEDVTPDELARRGQAKTQNT